MRYMFFVLIKTVNHEGHEVSQNEAYRKSLCVLCGCSPRSLRFKIFWFYGGYENLKSQRSQRRSAEVAEKEPLGVLPLSLYLRVTSCPWWLRINN